MHSDGVAAANSAVSVLKRQFIAFGELIRSNGRQVLAFSAVGIIGFVVDAGTLYLAIAAGLGLRAGRIVSYMAAVTATWVLNRRYTFEAGAERSQSLLLEWGRYVVTQLSGATLNLGTYYLLLLLSPELVGRWPVVAVAIGSFAGLSINYVAARVYVFRRGNGKLSSSAGSAS